METVSGGTRIHFEVHGSGPPVLLVHGYPLSGRMWDGVVDRLQDEYRLIVPDLRGHGDSDAAETASMEEHAEDLRAVLQAADEERPVVLVGMSMGGYISLAFCRRHRESVRALTLVDSRAGADSAQAAEARRRTAERVLTEGADGVAAEMVEKLFAPGAPAEMREEWRARMASTPPRGIAAALLGMAERPDSTALLRELSVPLLVIVGEHDAITPADEARAMAEGAGGEVEVVAGAGHIAPVEKPAEVAAALRRSLQTLG